MAKKSANLSPMNSSKGTAVKSAGHSGTRETIESLAVALILALLFRGFVAEAFVIPTGSMAPALTGAHKDVYCSECGARYQTGASTENRNGGIVVETYCENCRHENPVPFAEASGTTFSGDRICVSKFAYVLHEPKRWDVIVFKYPHNAKQNYIKRLVGLPNEEIHIVHGDLYRTTADNPSLEILRKPDDKLMAMRHLVYDTQHQSKHLIDAGFPSRWQPWSASSPDDNTSPWKVTFDADNWKASLTAAKSTEPTPLLRYFHNVATPDEWNQALSDRSLKDISPFRSGAITDFYAYNGYVYAMPSPELVDVLNDHPKGITRREWESEKLVHRDGSISSRIPLYDGNTNLCRDGFHWVSDLMLEASIKVGPEKGTLVLDLVRAGRHYQCDINSETGEASLWVIEDKERKPLHGKEPITAPTAIRSGGSYQIRFTNVDHELRLWVNQSRIPFNDATFTPPDFNNNRPYTRDDDPLDAAPAGIGGQNLSLDIDRLILYRDKYYTAVDKSTPYALNDYRSLVTANDMSNVQTTLSQPQSWDSTMIWQSRRTDVTFPLDKDQFLPMGDNSPESKDGRCWDSESYVERDLLIGKALFIYWPHPWHGFLPHFSRMGLIR